MSLPTADDLFRPTATREPEAETSVADPRPEQKPGKGPRTPSGRVKHEEKMTVYVTSEELLDLEHARLTLRRETGLGIDRGRLVREALAIVLADLEAHGEASLLVQRLAQQPTTQQPTTRT